jgi:hypothetical protein
MSDKQAIKFNLHWIWWMDRNAAFLRDANRDDVALAAAAAAWNAGVDWGRKNPLPPKVETGG